MHWFALGTAQFDPVVAMVRREGQHGVEGEAGHAERGEGVLDRHGGSLRCVRMVIGFHKAINTCPLTC